MAREYRLPPSASSLSASMRDIGYSLETAVADLIDNSISAGATNIEIFCNLTAKHPSLAIIDDGKGMDKEEMKTAMRHGSTNPKEKRSPDDLGRFGLGLKTASFSQCRQLTLASSQKGKRCSAEWNLDIVDEKDDWVISILNTDEIASLPFIDLLGDTGTIVLWRNLDRLSEGKTGAKRDEIVNEKLDILEKHLSLVFHRFLSGEIRGRKKITIAINGHNINSFDPFCRNNSATQLLPDEIVRVGTATVKIQPFILPHHSKLSAKEYDFYQDRSDFISNQGAYVYRNGRLMAWGDWFRLVPKGEATKLARVQIDFPNSLDESWTIDIRKSRAHPPPQIRERLRQVIARITDRSVTVHRGRGKRLFSEIKAPIWERYADQGKNIRYSLNREHPLVLALSDSLKHNGLNRLHILLESVSSSLPVETIYSDCSTHPKEMHQSQISEDAVTDRLKMLKEALFNGCETNPDTFRDVARSTRLFDAYMDTVDQFIQEELK